MRALALAAAALACLLLAGGLAPSSFAYDGAAFLLRASSGGIDYGHALYVPLLGVAERLAGSADPGSGGKLLSAAGLATALVLSWLRMVRGGAPFASAGLVAGTFAASTLLWQEGGSLEPTTWTVAALLAAGEAAGAYGRRPGWGRLALALAALGVALGFHVVSLLAVPWLVALARRSAAPIPRAHLVGVLAAGVGLVLLALAGGRLGAHLSYWSGFLPRFEDGVVRELAGHLRRGGRLLGEGAPVLVALALGCVVLRRLARDAADAGGAHAAGWLAGPYALAFVALGKPLVGLLVPVLLAAALRVGEELAREAAAERRSSGPVLALGLAVALAISAPQALAWHFEPDAPRVRAGLIGRYLPEGKCLLAGPLANHVRLFCPGIEVADVTQLVHQARLRDRRADPVEVVRAFAAASARPCVLASDAAAWLGSIGADVERLGLRPGAAFLVPEDPRLALFPLP